VHLGECDSHGSQGYMRTTLVGGSEGCYGFGVEAAAGWSLQ
jgi:hypothetical protein